MPAAHTGIERCASTCPAREIVDPHRYATRTDAHNPATEMINPQLDPVSNLFINLHLSQKQLETFSALQTKQNWLYCRPVQLGI